jgi:hypothetical protein
MSRLLDLCLTLTPPPAESQEGIIALVELTCDELGFRKPIELPPLVDRFLADDRRELEWNLESYWQWPYEGFARRGRQVEQSLADAV